MKKPQDQYIKDCFLKGKEGERIAAKLLTDAGWELTDVRNDPFYRELDIDFVGTRDGETVTFEVKSDQTGERTGNYFLESVSNINKGTPGWALYTQADVITIVQGKYVSFLPGPELVAWFTENQHRFYEITNPTYGHDKILKYYARGRLVRRDLFDAEVGILDMIRLTGNGFERIA